MAQEGQKRAKNGILDPFLAFLPPNLEPEGIQNSSTPQLHDHICQVFQRKIWCSFKQCG